ncbi:MAG: MBL fold metallo-hydrolase [Agathobacter sp.]|nr:MBL fold metallo-hydrolase [Agathobacter sp.]
MSFVEDVYNAELGKIHIFCVGQAGFVIKNSEGKLLGIDLYLSDYVEKVEGNIGFKRLLPKIAAPEELKLDVVIATHFHGDHYDYDAMPGLMINEMTRLYVAKDCKEMVLQQKISLDRTSFVSPGDFYRQAGFSIRFIKCDHGDGAPLAVGVILETDGKRFLFVGDSCLRMDWKMEYLQDGEIDVMIAPINGQYGNLNEAECAKLGYILNAKMIIPCHYGMFALHMGLPGIFYNEMCSKYPKNRFRLMCQGECYTLE